MRRVLVTCPLTSKTYRPPADAAFNGMPEIADVDEVGEGFMDLPPGWGAMVVYVKVGNPEWAGVMAIRQQAMAGMEHNLYESLRQAEEDGSQLPSEEDLDRARAAMMQQLDEQYPEPDPTVVAAYRLLDVSPDGISRIVQALDGVGVRLVPPGVAWGAEDVSPRPEPARAAPAAAAPEADVQAGTPSTGAPLPPPSGGQSTTPTTGATLPAPGEGA